MDWPLNTSHRSCCDIPMVMPETPAPTASEMISVMATLITAKVAVHSDTSHIDANCSGMHMAPIMPSTAPCPTWSAAIRFCTLLQRCASRMTTRRRSTAIRIQNDASLKLVVIKTKLTKASAVKTRKNTKGMDFLNVTAPAAMARNTIVHMASNPSIKKTMRMLMAEPTGADEYRSAKKKPMPYGIATDEMANKTSSAASRSPASG
mmetsp:Transcript_73744/g.240176  ORF Transcript_73744/g.240176 Transcript_73744/m.240176 type:complete len:206 (+) Transcript_73744:274-891(+)